MGYRTAAWLGCVVISACGSAALPQSQRAPVPTVQIAGSSRTVLSVTDLDQVRDATVSDARIHLATDRGVLSFARRGDEPDPRRLTRRDGLPSDDVRAVVALDGGELLVATTAGTVVLSEGVARPEPEPPVGRVADLVRDAAGTVWACGSAGLARRGSEGWQAFGESANCTLLEPYGDVVWAATQRALLRIEGDVIREHAEGQGIPEGMVHSAVPLEEGRVLVLTRDSSHSRLGYFDGERWFTYTLEAVDQKVVGLARHRGEAVLLLPRTALTVVRAARADGLALKPLAASETLTVRSYRARVTGGERPPATEEPASLPDPSSFLPVPTSLPPVEAPRLSAVPVRTRAVPDDPYAAWSEGGALLVADHNRGLVQVSEEGAVRELRSLDLVAEHDLRLASDAAAGSTWVVTDGGDLARFDGTHLVRVAPPEGTRPQVVATGPNGVYLVALKEQAPQVANTDPEAGIEQTASAPTPVIAVFVRGEGGWRPLMERSLRMAEYLLGLPYAAVAPDESVWVGLRVTREEEAGARMRGAVVLNPRDETVVYHHRGATEEADGPGALALPDEASTIDLGQDGYAWFASLGGAVRLGNHQAVVFGEARGVRGEVVSDVAVGENDRVWVAAAEGVGFWEDSRFDFALPPEVQAARVSALAVDGSGNLWGASANGAVFHDGARWTILTEAQGLPSASLRDVEVDASDRVWLLAADRLMVFAPEPADAGR